MPRLQGSLPNQADQSYFSDVPLPTPIFWYLHVSVRVHLGKHNPYQVGGTSYVSTGKTKGPNKGRWGNLEISKSRDLWPPLGLEEPGQVAVLRERWSKTETTKVEPPWWRRSPLPTLKLFLALSTGSIQLARESGKCSHRVSPLQCQEWWVELRTDDKMTGTLWECHRGLKILYKWTLRPGQTASDSAKFTEQGNRALSPRWDQRLFPKRVLGKLVWGKVSSCGRKGEKEPGKTRVFSGD